jgi:plastocyanin
MNAMKLNHSLAAFAGFAAALQLATAGNITGKITLSGTPPAEREITPLIQDANCGKLLGGAKPATKFFVVGANQELADVVVVLRGENLKGKSTGAAQAPVVVDQKACEYIPQILAVQTGQTILARNSDPVMHNVHTTPVAPGNKEENKGQGAGAPDLKFTIPAQESFLRFKCDVHPWMFAWVTVVDHPYFAVTGKDGTFTIKDVPPGKYKIEALHRRAHLVPNSRPAEYKGIEKEIEVTADGAKMDFVVELK